MSGTSGRNFLADYLLTHRNHSFLKTLRRTTVDRDYFLSRLYIAILDVLASKTLGRAPSPDHRAVAESFALSLTADGTIIGLQAREPRAQDPVVRKDLPQQADLQAEHDAGTKVRTSLEQLMTTEVKLNFSDPITFKVCCNPYLSSHRSALLCFRC